MRYPWTLHGALRISMTMKLNGKRNASAQLKLLIRWLHMRVSFLRAERSFLKCLSSMKSSVFYWTEFMAMLT